MNSTIYPDTPQNRFLWKFTELFSKIGEIFCWIGDAVMAVLLIVSLTNAQTISAFALNLVEPGITPSLNVLGCTIGTSSSDPAAGLMVVRFWTIAGVLGFGFFAMMFRNANLILRTIQGKTKFAAGATPFQKPVVRMIREIGIFMIALPVSQIILQVIAFLMIPDCNVSVTFLIYVFLGFLMICLSQCFEKGIQLEEETEGLI